LAACLHGELVGEVTNMTGSNSAAKQTLGHELWTAATGRGCV